MPRGRELIPRPGSAVTFEQAVAAERRIAELVVRENDPEKLKEWLKQADALAAWLQDRELVRPIEGARRRLEARIGQLLKPSHRGSRAGQHAYNEWLVPHAATRTRFRWLARALSGEVELTDEEWRMGRDRLASLIRRRWEGEPDTRGASARRASEKRAGFLVAALASAQEALVTAERYTDAAALRGLDQDQRARVMELLDDIRQTQGRIRGRVRRVR